jgi:hypothetical protein
VMRPRTPFDNLTAMSRKFYPASWFIELQQNAKLSVFVQKYTKFEIAISLIKKTVTDGQNSLATRASIANFLAVSGCQRVQIGRQASAAAAPFLQ